MEAFIRGEAVVAKIDGTDPPISFRAENIRKTRTGVHARVEVYAGPHLLGYDLFNVERHGDRVRLAGACAFKACPKDIMRVYIDGFCALVWPTWVTQFAPEELTPGLDDVTETRFLLRPYLAEGSGTILFAPPGMGKSYFALLTAQSINQGYGGIWRVEKAKVLYLNLERSRQSLKKRLALVNVALGLEVGTPLAMSNARGKTLAHVSEAIPKGAHNVVVLDSLSRSGAGSLKDDEDANAVMDAVNAMTESWLVIAHTPRDDATHVFGSQMFDAAADLILSLKSVRNTDDDLGLLVEGSKANDIPIPKAAVYKMSFDEYGLSRFGTALLSEFPGLADANQDRLETIKEYLLAVGKATVDDIAEELGVHRATIQKDLKAAQFAHRSKDGRRFLYSVKAQ